MKGVGKGLLFCLLFVVILVGSIIGLVVLVLNGEANANEYKFDNDTISSVKAVVGKRDINRSEFSTNPSKTSKTLEYKSNTVQEDLTKYIEHLRKEEGFLLITDMDLSISSGVVALAKESKDSGKIITMAIDYNYNKNTYTIEIEKYEGTVNLKD